MSGFSADWLALREPADTRARDAAGGLLDALPGGRDPHGAGPRGTGTRTADPVGAREVLDLGAGTGANYRYLHARLGAVRRWTLADHDPALLRLAVANAPAGDPAPDTVVIDLAAALENLSLPEGGLVTASALLDLVSAPWLERLASRCRTARAAVLFALTYDGRARCWPQDRDDAAVIALVNLHQRTDKGFGPALGPDAAVAAARHFERVGYRLRRARSDWRIGPDEPALQAALLEGWAQAAREIAPRATPQVDGWLRRRLRHLRRGRSTLGVGHEDLAGVPAD
jgi:SAM-dependent methyltransferase